MGFDWGHASSLAAKQRVPSGGVDDPSRRGFDPVSVGALDRQPVAVAAAQLERRHARGTPELGSFFHGDSKQMLVELGAIELKGRRAGELSRTDLRGLPQAGHLVVDEPVTKRLLGKLLAGKVIVLLQNAR